MLFEIGRASANSTACLQQPALLGRCASDDAGMVLSVRLGVTPQTICKWRRRDSVEDCSHTPHRLQTTLTPALGAAGIGADQHQPQDAAGVKARERDRHRAPLRHADWRKGVRQSIGDRFKVVS